MTNTFRIGYEAEKAAELVLTRFDWPIGSALATILRRPEVLDLNKEQLTALIKAINKEVTLFDRIYLLTHKLAGHARGRVKNSRVITNRLHKEHLSDLLMIENEIKKAMKND